MDQKFEILRKEITGSSDLDYWRWSDATREEEQTKLGSRPAATKTRKIRSNHGFYVSIYIFFSDLSSLCFSVVGDKGNRCIGYGRRREQLT